MTHKLLKNLIEPYIEKVSLEIQQERRGVLYKAINLIINSLEREPSEAQEVYNYFEIKENSYIEDDFGIIYDNIAKIYIDPINKILNLDKIDVFHIIPKLEKPAFTKFCSNLEDKQQMEVIVVTAFILISTLALVGWKSSNRNQHQPKLPEQKVTKALPHQSVFVPSSICLAVPASAVYDLHKGTIIDRDKIIKLIDAASDFLCIKVKEAPLIEIDTDQTPSPDSQLKFYIRIDIPDGRDIIGGETKYVIKRSLSPNITGEIKELGRLGSVSSISSFNRV